MASSPEYPDLPWVEPRSWSGGRTAGNPRVIVIHTTEGHEGFTAAEDGAAYDQRRTDGTSTHYFHDPDSTIQCVRTADRAHAARRNGNAIGIQHELCGRAGQTDPQWDDANSNAIIRRAARQAARDCRRWGIPAVRLTPSQVRAGAKGFCGHVDITYAYPEDEGTHTDPGPRFPWAEFMSLVREELGDDVPAEEILNYTYDDGSTAKNNWHYAYLWTRQLLAELPGLRTAVQTLAEAYAADRDVTPEELAAAVEAGVKQAGDALTAALLPQLTAGLVAGLTPLLEGASEDDVQRIVAEVVAGVRLVPAQA